MNTVTRIKRISPVQLGKMLAVIYALVSLIAVPFFLLFGVMGLFANSFGGGSHTSGALGVGLGLGMMLVFPVMYAVFGFIGGVIGGFVYNLVAKWVGGIEVEFEASSIQSSPPPPL